MKVKGRISHDPTTVPRQAMEEKDTLNLFPSWPSMLRIHVGTSVPSEDV